MSDANGIGDAKLAQRIIDAYSDLDALTYEECEGTGLGKGECKALVEVLGQGNDGIVTYEERGYLQIKKFSDKFISALAGSGGMTALMNRVKRLGDIALNAKPGDLEASNWALSKLADIGTLAESAVQVLKQVINKYRHDPKIVKVACVALCEIGSGSEPAIPELKYAIQTFGHYDLELLTFASTALRRIGEPAVPAMMKLLTNRIDEDDSDIIREAVLSELVSMGHYKAYEAIAALEHLRKTDSDAIFRVTIGMALKELKGGK